LDIPGVLLEAVEKGKKVTMKLLTIDIDTFLERFPAAAAFINAAELRLECHHLAVTTELSPWQTMRLEQLLRAPACREPWFVDLLRQDGRGMEDFLLHAGL
jgi:hypothetical protein